MDDIVIDHDWEKLLSPGDGPADGGPFSNDVNLGDGHPKSA